MKNNMFRVILSLISVLILNFSNSLVGATTPCVFDYEHDGDVDGNDLVFIVNSDGFDIESFAYEFGRADCTVEVIIDNRDSNVEFTGDWQVSGGLEPYGIDSFWSRDGTIFLWLFIPEVTGKYKFSMWWTEWPSRSTYIPVEIETLEGPETVYIDQQVNDGKWNELGSFSFVQGRQYNVKITSQPDPSSTCADAVKFEFEKSIPVAVIDSISPNPSSVGEQVAFSGHGETPIGSIDVYEWGSSINGYLGGNATFSTSSLSEGAHVISLRVRDDQGEWSGAITQALFVGNVSTDAFQIVVDNGDAGTYLTGDWSLVTGSSGYAGDYLWNREDGGSIYRWRVNPVVGGNYGIYLWWVEDETRSTRAPVEIQHASGTEVLHINQQENGGQWNLIGVYHLDSGAGYDITLVDERERSTVCADAVKVVHLFDPFLKIVTPHTHYFQVSSSIYAQAAVGNVQPGWKVRFVLDEGEPGEQVHVATVEPYETTFTGVGVGEHTVDAYLLNQTNGLVPGSYSHDQVIQVGIGAYIGVMGDSISNGEKDDVFWDDTSQDGRVAGGGYGPVLCDLLTTGVPYFISNESVGGSTSQNGRDLVNEVLVQNAEAQMFLVQFGTNDAKPLLPIPSGLGLSPGDSGYPGTYKDNMQHIIDAIRGSGKEVALAKPPIALGNTTTGSQYPDPEEGIRNVIIREYNLVINELINDSSNGITVSPPDFYTYFGSIDPGTGRYRYEDQYGDNLHPNGVGYQSMAQLWLEALTN